MDTVCARIILGYGVGYRVQTEPDLLRLFTLRRRQTSPRRIAAVVALHVASGLLLCNSLHVGYVVVVIRRYQLRLIYRFGCTLLFVCYVCHVTLRRSGLLRLLQHGYDSHSVCLRILWALPSDNKCSDDSCGWFADCRFVYKNVSTDISLPFVRFAMALFVDLRLLPDTSDCWIWIDSGLRCCAMRMHAARYACGLIWMPPVRRVMPT